MNDVLGNTPLHILLCGLQGLSEEEFKEACLVGDALVSRIKYVEVLNSRNNLGNAALLHAAFNGYGSLVDILLRADVAVNCFNDIGRTPVMLVFRNPDLAYQLKAAGADTHVMARSGRTLWDIATHEVKDTISRSSTASDVSSTTVESLASY